MCTNSNRDSTSAILSIYAERPGSSLLQAPNHSIKTKMAAASHEHEPLFSQTSHDIRRSTASKFKLFELIRGKEVDIAFWDIVVITALDESQKDAYDIQIQSKLARRELPLGVKYHVFYDPPGPKIGNGGSVLVTIGDLLKIYDEKKLMNSKILMLPAGGYSQRLPNASVLGKAFTALPIGKFVITKAVLYFYMSFVCYDV